MLVIDVNVVLAAHRADHPHYAVVRPWFDEILAARHDFAVPHMVWASFLRLATNRRIFPVPTPLAEAFAFVEATSAQPAHLAIAPGARHLNLVRRLCEEADATGDLVPDAVLGALALEHAGEIVTLDRDFARFTSVRHFRPPTAGPRPNLSGP
ncbi:MAG: type II toxin-antitoxin system VapC family toxin [Actinomycetota bacterium]